VTAPSLFERAAATDVAYFEMGAEIEDLPGAALAWMSGLTGLAAGAVVQRVNGEVAARMGSGWVSEIEEALASVGAPLARVYLDEGGPAGALLGEAGYTMRPELVFAHAMGPTPGEVELLRLDNDEAWDRKERLHKEADRTPDGHPSSASDWVELERRKAADGLETYLAMIDGEVVGAIGAIRGDRILRFKNILIHPDHRRRGLGRAMLNSLAALGRESGILEQTVFAVRGNAGERLYRACGMQTVGTVVEWSKPLGVSNE
jgi:GNAT superfamily N-acetyltransferase